jgi:isoaspartyl peptidase/L-asparaginase-like protein (Ntn-hydrolase superfamily)
MHRSGEAIIRLVLAKRAVDFLHEVDNGEAQTAARMAIAHLEERLQSTGGIILIDRSGKSAMRGTQANAGVLGISEDKIGMDS